MPALKQVPLAWRTTRVQVNGGDLIDPVAQLREYLIWAERRCLTVTLFPLERRNTKRQEYRREAAKMAQALCVPTRDLTPTQMADYQ